MSNKETCPVCGTESSRIYDGKDCPQGCSIKLQREVAHIRRQVQDEKVQAQHVAMAERAVRAEQALQQFADDVRSFQLQLTDLKKRTDELDASLEPFRKKPLSDWW